MSFTEKIGTISPYGKAFFQISGVFHQLECHHGSDLDESGHLVENALEQRIIMSIRNLRDKGHTMDEIRNFLRYNSTPTKSGKAK